MGGRNAASRNRPAPIIAFHQGDLGLRPSQAELADVIRLPCCGLVQTDPLQALGDVMRGQWLLPIILAGQYGGESFASYELDGAGTVFTHMRQQRDRVAG